MLKQRASRPRGIRWLAVWLVTVVLGLVIAWVLLVPAADWLARHDVGSARGPVLQTARDAARGRLLTLGAGLFAAGALVFTALNFDLLRRTAAQADQWQRRIYDLTEQGQVTDRYIRAIEQLGSDKLDVRAGGIYALERIARDSPADRAPIAAVLTAFVRSHAPWPPSLPGQYLVTTPIDQVPKLQTRAPDVQASLWVLGRGGFADALGEDDWLDLSSIDLRRADLRAARLGAVDLRFAGLQRAYLGGAHLEGAYFAGSHLEGARLIGAHLDRAVFEGAHLEGAVGDVHTSWPDGFDWHAAGVTAED